jgi:hypothetical protein
MRAPHLASFDHGKVVERKWYGWMVVVLVGLRSSAFCLQVISPLLPEKPAQQKYDLEEKLP